MNKVRLGDACDFLNGGTPSKANSKFFRGEIPWITGADITSSVVTQARSFITEEAIKSSATNKVTAGTILLVTRTSVGKVALAGLDLCFSQDITAIKPHPGTLDKGYLLRFLENKAAHFKSNARGATIQGITRDVVTDLEIPLPPLDEQERIAARLDAAEQLRAWRRDALARLDALAHSLFLDMFGDPAHNPKGWPIVKLGELGTLDRGISKHRPRDEPSLFGGAYPFIQTGDVANSSGYIRKYKQTYTEEGLAQSKLWKEGTLCITIAANIAKTGILTFDACFPDSVVGFTPTQSNIEFVRLWFSFVQKKLEDYAPESAQKNINLKILRELEIFAPPLSLQQEFADKLAQIEMVRARMEASRVELDALFASLQNEVFGG